MNNLPNISNATDLIPYAGGLAAFTQSFFSTIPMALAAPILSYQKTKAQEHLIAIAIQAKRRERTEILATIRCLAQHGQLTDELSRALIAAYNAQSY